MRPKWRSSNCVKPAVNLNISDLLPIRSTRLGYCGGTVFQSVSIRRKQAVIILATTSVAVFVASAALSLNDVASTAELVVPVAYNVITATLLILVALGSAAVLSTRPQRTVFNPLESLSEVVRRVRDSRDYSFRATVHRQDGVGRLAADFNSMMAEIERRFETAFDSAAIGIFLVDENRAIFQINQFFAEMLGYEKHELDQKLIREISHPDDREIGVYPFEDLKAGRIENYQIEKRYLHKDGHAIWALCYVSAVRDGNGQYQHAITHVQDITEARQLSTELSYQATHDSLTSLVNRHEFEVRIESALLTAQRDDREHAICYLDLDQFKVINDTCGHVAGDELLRQISNLLRSKVRNNDTIARPGGDEFGLLMEGCPLVQAHRAAENLRTAIEDFQFVWDDIRFRIGVSIGVVLIDSESSGVTEVLQQADTACYAAKDKGRNRVHLFLREDEELAKRRGEMRWVTEIQAALETDRYRLYVQPIVPVHLTESGYEHYEVLIRMIDANGGEIPPGAFLPAAERYGLAARIDRWVLSHLLEWLANNRAVAERVSMFSVNLSGLTLANELFLGYAIHLLKESQVPTNKICFEITETAVISNLSQATRFISTLKDLGCLFALDDFGSGLSSFAYLKSLPVDYLKIDGMFVRDVHIDPINRALVKSINDVGKVMGKRTIAEFVENNDVLEVLAELNVDYGQGYGIGKPFPLDELGTGAEPLAASG